MDGTHDALRVRNRQSRAAAAGRALVPPLEGALWPHAVRAMAIGLAIGLRAAAEACLHPFSPCSPGMRALVLRRTDGNGAAAVVDLSIARLTAQRGGCRCPHASPINADKPHPQNGDRDGAGDLVQAIRQQRPQHTAAFKVGKQDRGGVRRLGPRQRGRPGCGDLVTPDRCRRALGPPASRAPCRRPRLPLHQSVGAGGDGVGRRTAASWVLRHCHG